MLPLSDSQLAAIMERLNIASLSRATIRQVVAVAAMAEKESGESFSHLEVGNPGLPPNPAGTEAEIEALRSGVASVYPPVMGCPELKRAGSRFIRAFLNADVPAECVVPSVGSMQGSFSMLLLLSFRDPARDTMLYLNPGFAPQHLQARLVGLKEESLDIYDCRGEALERRLEEILSRGNITGILYSNPNNPAWTNLTPDELAIIGRVATKYDAIVLEDLAYMGMDFRRDCGTPGQEPYVPTVARYTDNYVLLVSASKIFSYAGQRVALVAMSPAVFRRHEQALEDMFGFKTLGDAYIFGVVYALSSGVAHSAQIAMAHMLDAAAEGRLNFVADCREYERRCRRARKIFADAGFHLVYSHDDGEPLSHGFFFTAEFADMDSETLQRALMRHGIASISLPGTGSGHDGVRVCVSRLASDADFDNLSRRLESFAHEQQATH